MHFSEAQKAAILTWAKELGVKNVPSAYAIKKCQEQIHKLIGDPTDKFVSNSGTVFYMNDVGKAIAKVCVSHIYSVILTMHRIMQIL